VESWGHGMLSPNARGRIFTVLAYLVVLLLVTAQLWRMWFHPMTGLAPLVLVVPTLLGVVGIAWLLRRRPEIRRRVLGDVPPSRRATAVSAAALSLGALLSIGFLPDGADWDWLVVYLLLFSWTGPSILILALVSSVPEAINRGAWVTVGRLAVAVLGALVLAVLGSLALGYAEFSQRGALLRLWLFATALFVGVLGYLRFDSARQR